jgi:hypothetical protein
VGVEQCCAAARSRPECEIPCQLNHCATVWSGATDVISGKENAAVMLEVYTWGMNMQVR